MNKNSAPLQAILSNCREVCSLHPSPCKEGCGLGFEARQKTSLGRSPGMEVDGMKNMKEILGYEGKDENGDGRIWYFWGEKDAEL